MALADRSGAATPDAQQRLQAQQLLLLFAQLGALITTALQERVERGLVSNVEVLVITELDLRGPMRPADIQALTGMTSGGVTKLLDRLEAAGVISRAYGQVQGDRRGVRVELTDKGGAVASLLVAGLLSQLDTIRGAVAEIQAVVGG
jgi:DNA-binding MarR family transcriptional regulator